MRKFIMALAVGMTISAGWAAANGPYNTGCSSCGPQGGCDNGSCKTNWLDRFKGNGCNSFDNGCNTSWWGKFKNNDCNSCGGNAFIDALHWYKKPCGLNAPTWRNTDHPLAFPSHPYIRSPRDYFMVD
jgi:hypothetical protein